MTRRRLKQIVEDEIRRIDEGVGGMVTQASVLGMGGNAPMPRMTDAAGDIQPGRVYQDDRHEAFQAPAAEPEDPAKAAHRRVQSMLERMDEVADMFDGNGQPEVSEMIIEAADRIEREIYVGA